MKATWISSLAIILMAIFIGGHQRRRIDELEKELGRKRESVAWSGGRSNRGDPDSPKVRARETRPSAEEAFGAAMEKLVVRNQAVAGAAVVMDHREAFDEIMKLNLEGQLRFLELVARADDPKFSDDLWRCVMVNLCLCAMADRDPAVALECIVDVDERIGEFYEDRFVPDPMRGYCLARLLETDLDTGLEALVALEERQEFRGSWQDQQVKQALVRAAREEPGAVLAVASELPGSGAEDVCQMVAEGAANEAECGRVFRAARREGVADQVLPALCDGLARRGGWRGLADWLGGHTLSDQEKLAAAGAIVQRTKEEEVIEVARWCAGYLPDSDVRDRMLWDFGRAWGSSDPEAAMAFLQQQGIDEARVAELEVMESPERFD